MRATRCRHPAHSIIIAVSPLFRARSVSACVSLAVFTQCIVLDDPKTGSRKVAGTHWDFNSYGGELKKAMGIAPQACAFPYLLAGQIMWLCCATMECPLEWEPSC